MKNDIFSISVAALEIHPEVAKTYQEKKTPLMEMTMKSFGQQQQISIVKRGDNFYIVDGVTRFRVAQLIGLRKLNCVELEITDQEVLDCRIRINQTVKKSITEKCLMVEYVLGILGKSQGKKRESLGFQINESEENIGLMGKDRFELACVILDLDMKPSTLRKLMSVYWEESGEGQKNVGVLKLLDEGKISISKAFDLLQEKKRKINDKKLRKLKDFESKTADVNYKLFNKSSMDLSDIPNNSIRLSIQSPPYFQLRDYRNQDELFHGQEPSVAEYIKNEILFYRGVREKLDDNGVMAIIIGETYRGGYQGVCNKLEIALEQDGWQVLDVNQWVKTNPKSQPHENRFLPAYERIIVCTKKGANPIFNDQKKPSSHGKFKVIRGTEKVDGTIGFSMSSPEASITNVITTACFNRREFGGVDSGFTHDAPAPMEIYDKFILAYSNPNDIILDMFSGSGQGLVSAIRNGRNAIGYDVDPVSIEFSKKRLDIELENRQPNILKIAA